MLSESQLDEIEVRLQSMSDEELIEFQDNLMDVILEKKMNDGMIVFSGVENGLLN